MNSECNPYRSPSAEFQRDESTASGTGQSNGRLSFGEAVWESVVVSTRTCIVLIFIVWGTGTFISGLLNTAFRWDAIGVGILTAAIVVCPPTFIATLIELRKRPAS